MSGDTHVLRGIGAIVNPTNTKSGVNYEQIANSMINSGVIDKPRDPTELFDAELKNMMRDMHLNFDTPGRATGRSPGRATGRSPGRATGRSPGRATAKPPPSRPSESRGAQPPGTASFKTPYAAARHSPSSSEASSDESSRHTPSSAHRSPEDHRSPEAYRSPRDRGSSRDRGSPRDTKRTPNYGRSDTKTGSPRHSASRPGRQSAHRSTPKESPRVKEYRHPSYESQPTYNHGSEYHRRTVEEDRHAQIHNVMKGMGGDGEHIFNLENEKVEDMKAQMLVDIEFMKSALDSEGIEVDKYPKLDNKSSYRDIEDLQKILRLKLDRIRYSSLADDFILTGASLVEDVFDGERVWFGRYRPDMRDWSKQVQAKLRRMRHDTSTIMGGVMNNYNIGPFSRLCLELVPNGFLYAKKNNSSARSGSVSTPSSREAVARSISSIRDISDR